MKSARLDQILLRLGYVTETQIQDALLRQKARGGRIGTHLLYLGHIDEDQLADALSRQFKVARYDSSEHRIDLDAVRVVPATLAADLQILPVSFDTDSELLTLIVADPSDTPAINRVRRLFDASRVNCVIAPESVVDTLIKAHTAGGDSSIESRQIIELPELFERSLGDRNSPEKCDNRASTDVLMVTKALCLRDFLVPVFRREGYRLLVHADPDEIAVALKESSVERLLVSQDVVDDYGRWRDEGRLGVVPADVAVFSGVAESVLGNPVPYKPVFRTLLRAAEMLSESKCASNADWAPPYGPIRRDIRDLGLSAGLGRVAVDGAQLAATLLLPAGDVAGVGTGLGVLPFRDVRDSIETARSLGYPWDIAAVVDQATGLFDERTALPDGNPDEVALAAQVIALVWWRHVALRGAGGFADTVAAEMKSKIRAQIGRLSTLEVVELYVRSFDLAGEIVQGDFSPQVMILTPDDGLYRQLAGRLKRARCRPLWVEDVGEAVEMCGRVGPAAVVYHDDGFPGRRDEVVSMLGKMERVAGYAFSLCTDAAGALDLLDAGFDDVLTPPHDYDVIAARIVRSARAGARETRPKPGGFEAGLDALSFLDLIQTLGQGLRSVRLALRRDNGESAVMFLEKGRLIFAVAGALRGAEAVYRVISWENDGNFSVEPAIDFPAPNVREANESLLMEGCRLLDESRV